MTGIDEYAEQNRMLQNLVVCIGKSEAEVTNNTRGCAVAERPRDDLCSSISKFGSSFKGCCMIL